MHAGCRQYYRWFLERRWLTVGDQDSGREFLAVHFRVLPCSMVLVLGGLQVVTKCNPSVMRGFLVIARFVMLGGLAMMFGSVFIVLGCLFVMLVYLVLCHFVFPDMPPGST